MTAMTKDGEIIYVGATPDRIRVHHDASWENEAGYHIVISSVTPYSVVLFDPQGALVVEIEAAAVRRIASSLGTVANSWAKDSR